MKKNYQLFIFSIGCWLSLFLLKIYDIFPQIKLSQFSAKIEILLHFFMVAWAFTIYKNVNKENQNILLWLLLLNVGLFLNDVAFYVLIYLSSNFNFHLSMTNFIIIILPYSTWVISALFFLIKLVNKIYTPNYFLKLFLVLMVINCIIICLFLYSAQPVFEYLSWQTISQIISSFAELLIFDLGVVCLIYSENEGLSFFIIGLIILISGDFIINYSFLSQTNSITTYGELFWLLGVVFIFFGIYSLQSQGCYVNKWLRATNSIKGKLAFWAFGLSIVNILPFFILAYLLSPLNKSVFLIMPSFFMLTSLSIVIFSLLTVKQFELPFKKIADNIESLMLDNDKSKFNSLFVIEEFIFLQEFILKVFDLKEEREEAKKALVSLTAQVAHDIRSPLTALNICLKDLPQLSDSQRIMMRNVANRINDIANNLLQQYVGKKIETVKDPLYLHTCLLAPLIESIISEKRLQFIGMPIELESIITSEGFSAFATFDSSRMKRLLSNLINNSSEAFSGRGGKIILKLDAWNGKVFLKIIDNGCGIAAGSLQHVFNFGESTKKEGAGLGLADAKAIVEKFGGKLELNSILNQGTVVEITLPSSEPPNWFVSEILISTEKFIVIIDDDQSVHDAWNQRLISASTALQICHFNTFLAFSDWYTPQIGPLQIFSDYELTDEKNTGLDFFENLHIDNQSILVTSHYENKEIIQRCQNEGIKLLPKNLLTHIPVRLIDVKHVELILIDDSISLCQSWEFASVAAGKKILTFTNTKDFEKYLIFLDRMIVIYIDSDLNDTIRGEIYAEFIYKQGFKEIFLVTGYPVSHFDNLPWIKAVVDKAPPFIG
ncbi:MAG: HAMP domain-containing histidine kinase [Legionella sp.]|nr:HAMP domain-containing histidine kinase [Legionella sp.]